MSRTQISIKTKHLTDIENFVKHSMLFNTPEEYLDYVLEELLLDSSENSDQSTKPEALEQRLRDLGYL